MAYREGVHLRGTTNIIRLAGTWTHKTPHRETHRIRLSIRTAFGTKVHTLHLTGRGGYSHPPSMYGTPNKHRAYLTGKAPAPPKSGSDPCASSFSYSSSAQRHFESGVSFQTSDSGSILSLISGRHPTTITAQNKFYLGESQTVSWV